MQPTTTCKIMGFLLSTLLVIISIIAYYKSENFVANNKELESWYSNRIDNLIRLQMKVIHQDGSQIETNCETYHIMNGSKPLSFYISENDNSLLVLRIPQKYCSECNDELFEIMHQLSNKLLEKTLIIVPKHLHRDFYAKFVGSGYEFRIISVSHNFHSFDIIDEVNPYFFIIKENRWASSYFIFNRNETDQTKQYLSTCVKILNKKG